MLKFAFYRQYAIICETHIKIKELKNLYRFIREKILPLFLAHQMTFDELSKASGVSHRTCQRAVNGEKITAPIVTRICKALGIGPNEQLKFIQGV